LFLELSLEMFRDDHMIESTKDYAKSPIYQLLKISSLKLIVQKLGHGFKILKKIFSPEFQNVKFCTFRLINIQRGFSHFDFQKVVLF